jgi:hypothetical protein
MERRLELLDRVREGAEALAALASTGTNIPLNDYIDRASLDALCDSLALDPEEWQPEDLERILIIRDHSSTPPPSWCSSPSIAVSQVAQSNFLAQN